ncbi:MAG: hypothetical protein HQL13_06740, partial [Candidatus Omnitrophica bacterium]|nr:hypothetical protein [Candidatus Omnitrophota bacterium]
TLLVYALPLAFYRQRKDFLFTLLPYLTCLVPVHMLVCSVNYEYRALCLLGFLPMLMPWLIKFYQEREYVVTFMCLFIIFLFFAFHGFWFVHKELFSDKIMMMSYFYYYFVILIYSGILFYKKFRSKYDCACSSTG